MADQDTTLKEDDELEIVEVDKIPTEAEIAAAAAAKAAEAEDAQDDDDEDERLAEDHSGDGDDAAATEAKKKKRDSRTRAERNRQRREAQAKLERDYSAERAARIALEERIARLEGTTIDSRKQDIDEKISAAKRKIADAEIIHARAIEAGNGDDAVEAMRLRDEARDAERFLAAQKQQLDRPAPPTIDARAKSLSDSWKSANPWYDGQSEESLIVNALDNRLAAEGYDPRTEGYWSELTRRAAKRLGAAEVARKTPPADPARKTPPPLGATREHAPPSTRREVYVTPERKQAMQEAGIWDDPAKRARMLRTYADYDRNAAS